PRRGPERRPDGGDPVPQHPHGPGQLVQREPRRRDGSGRIVAGDREIRAQASQVRQVRQRDAVRRPGLGAAGHTGAASRGWRGWAAAGGGRRSRSASGANTRPIVTHNSSWAATEYNRKLNSTSAGNPGYTIRPPGPASGSGVSVARWPVAATFAGSSPSCGNITITTPIAAMNAAPATRLAFQLPSRGLSHFPSH